MRLSAPNNYELSKKSRGKPRGGWRYDRAYSRSSAGKSFPEADRPLTFALCEWDNSSSSNSCCVISAGKLPGNRRHVGVMYIIHTGSLPKASGLSSFWGVDRGLIRGVISCCCSSKNWGYSFMLQIKSSLHFQWYFSHLHHHMTEDWESPPIVSHFILYIFFRISAHEAGYSSVFSKNCWFDLQKCSQRPVAHLRWLQSVTCTSHVGTWKSDHLFLLYLKPLCVVSIFVELENRMSTCGLMGSLCVTDSLLLWAWWPSRKLPGAIPCKNGVSYGTSGNLPLQNHPFVLSPTGWKRRHLHRLRFTSAPCRPSTLLSHTENHCDKESSKLLLNALGIHSTTSPLFLSIRRP